MVLFAHICTVCPTLVLAITAIAKKRCKNHVTFSSCSDVPVFFGGNGNVQVNPLISD